jgi:hypothetical protein
MEPTRAGLLTIRWARSAAPELGMVARKLVRPCAWMSAAAVCLMAQFLLMQGIPVAQPLRLGQVQPAGGQAYMVQLEPVSRYLAAPSDDTDSPQRSSGLVLEDGSPLGPAHSLHDTIRQHGGGLFSHWQNWLIFSARDGSDPRQNGRTYIFEARHFLVEPFRTWANLAVAAFAAFLATVAIVTLGGVIRKRIRVALDRPIILDRMIRGGAAIAFLVSAICFYGSFFGVHITVSIEPNSFQSSGGHAYAASIEPPFWFLWTPHDRLDDPVLSSMVLLENDVALGPAHAEHALIRRTGGGAFSHWAGHLLFSTGDNSDPRQNGRTYAARAAWLLITPVNRWVLYVASGLAVVGLCLSLLAFARTGGRRVEALVLILPPLLTLLIGELAARLLRSDAVHRWSPYVAVASDYLPLTLAPHLRMRHETSEFDITYSTNLFGYRGKYPTQINKPVATRRVILLGDSFTFGWGVNEESSFAGILTKEFENEGVEIINAGYHAGYAPDAYYAYMQREGLALKPDLIVVVIYSGNDLVDMRDSFWTKVDGFGAPLSLRTSRRYAGSDGLVSVNPYPCEATYSLSRSYLATLACMSIFPTPEPAAQALYDNSQSMEIKFSTVLRAFSHLSDIVPVTYVLVPPPSLYSTKSDMRHQEVALLLQNEPSVRYLDLSPRLNGNYYYPKDGHLTAQGQSAVASYLAPLLRTNLSISRVDNHVRLPD